MQNFERTPAGARGHVNVVNELADHRKKLISVLSSLDLAPWPSGQAVPESQALSPPLDGDPMRAQTLLYNYRDLLAPVADHAPELWQEPVATVQLPSDQQGAAPSPSVKRQQCPDRVVRARPRQRGRSGRDRLALSLARLDDWRARTVTQRQPKPGLDAGHRVVDERVFLPARAIRRLTNQLLTVEHELGLGVHVEEERTVDVAPRATDDQLGEMDLPDDD